jgi:predicted amidohydrolase
MNMDLTAVFALGVFCAGAWANGESPVGRPVRILSLSFSNEPLEAIRALIDREAARGVDLVVLPETWRGLNDSSMEMLDGPAISAMSALARKHHTYIASPIDRRDGEHRWNSVVLLDREGKIVFIYNKAFPYWSEFDLQKKMEVGRTERVYQADFGKIGFAICFDVNFPEVWKALADEGAELVVFQSAYSAGTSLQAHALTHHYYVVSSTGARDCTVYDITGEQIFYQKSKDINVARVTLDLDRRIFHENFNLAKRDRLLREHPDEVEQEQHLEREAWFVLRARRTGVNVRDLARQYGMEELRDYIDRSRREIDAMRGWPFSRAADQAAGSGGSR